MMVKETSGFCAMVRSMVNREKQQSCPRCFETQLYVQSCKLILATMISLLSKESVTAQQLSTLKICEWNSLSGWKENRQLWSWKLMLWQWKQRLLVKSRLITINTTHCTRMVPAIPDFLPLIVCLVVDPSLLINIFALSWKAHLWGSSSCSGHYSFSLFHWHFDWIHHWY